MFFRVKICHIKFGLLPRAIKALAGPNLNIFVEADIRNAVRTGMEVTAHENTINFHGRPSAGYMVIDPSTGAGGYLIAGGENGGFLAVFGLFAFVIVAGVLTGGWALLAVIWALINFAVWVNAIGNAENSKQFNQANALAALGLSLSFLGLPALGAEGISLLLFSEAFIFMLGAI